MKSLEPFAKWGLITLLLLLLYSFNFNLRPIFSENNSSIREDQSSSMGIDELPLDENDLFSGSGNCVLCHGDPDQYPSSTANLDSLGNDVSPVNLWRATMMANSAKDPFWRAKVSHEGIVNPGLVEEIETICTSCHAPLGHFNAFFIDEDSYTMEDLMNDPLGLDGVSCNACHMIEDIGLGITFSADITYNEDHVEYGQFESPFANPMINHTGFTPAYSSHISSSEACGKCHTLITEAIDEEGEILENSFVEQAVYHEWLNSEFSQNDIACVDCHMPKLEEEVILSPMPSFLASRSDFAKHDLVGGNVFMLKMLKDNSEALALNASPAQFDEAILKTSQLLQEAALDLELSILEENSDSIVFEVMLKNKSGHKLPSGYPSRKMMIEFMLLSTSGDTLFHSGGFDGNGRINGEDDDGFEPHYDQILNENEVQIYEYVMGNEEAEVTTILTRAYAGLKDNRIPPLGFTSGHLSYDTVQIIGNASNDGNFNILDGTEGSAKDFIYYHIPIQNSSEGMMAKVKVHYIAVPRKWLDQLFDYESEEIDAFESMYDQMEMRSVIMKEDSLFFSINSIEEMEDPSIQLYPNPTKGELYIYSEIETMSKISVYDVQGKEIMVYPLTAVRNMMIDLPNASGKYLLKIEFDNGASLIKAVIKT